MWRNIIPAESATLSAFEKKFHFTIHSPFREYLLEHNNGIPSPGTILTAIRERQMVQLLDFTIAICLLRNILKIEEETKIDWPAEFKKHYIGELWK